MSALPSWLGILLLEGDPLCPILARPTRQLMHLPLSLAWNSRCYTSSCVFTFVCVALLGFLSRKLSTQVLCKVSVAQASTKLPLSSFLCQDRASSNLRVAFGVAKSSCSFLLQSKSSTSSSTVLNGSPSSASRCSPRSSSSSSLILFDH